eukprot:scaffold1804_cov263-Pinguiococcus_pyrenoidosus.AAC.30
MSVSNVKLLLDASSAALLTTNSYARSTSPEGALDSMDLVNSPSTGGMSRRTWGQRLTSGATLCWGLRASSPRSRSTQARMRQGPWE